jgi:hypothetical protein
MYEYLAFLPIILPIIGAILTYVFSKYLEKLQDIFLVVYSSFLFILYAAHHHTRIRWI